MKIINDGNRRLNVSAKAKTAGVRSKAYAQKCIAAIAEMYAELGKDNPDQAAQLRSEYLTIDKFFQHFI